MPRPKIAFVASPVPVAQTALRELSQLYGDVPQDKADVIVALGGDGFMLQTLHATQGLDVPVYGMNRGTVGFLMNEFAADDLTTRLDAAEEEVINPLAMTAGFETLSILREPGTYEKLDAAAAKLCAGRVTEPRVQRAGQKLDGFVVAGRLGGQRAIEFEPATERGVTGERPVVRQDCR